MNAQELFEHLLSMTEERRKELTVLIAVPSSFVFPDMKNIDSILEKPIGFYDFDFQSLIIIPEK